MVFSARYPLASTIDQPVTGQVVSGGGDADRLASGFLTAPGALGGAVFRNGFELDTGNCAP